MLKNVKIRGGLTIKKGNVKQYEIKKGRESKKPPRPF
jgi:hypothetical protein